MADYDQRIFSSSHTALQSRFSGNTRAASGTAAPSLTGAAHSQGMSFSTGQIIRGRIIDLRNHDIKVQLSGNQVLSGRIDDAARLAIGEEASFQVTRADAYTVALKVVSDSRTASREATIDKALDAANLPKSDHNISAVRALLSQELSVDKNSIQNLLRQSAMYRGVSFQSLAILLKNQLPLSQVNGEQLDAYINYEHRISQLADKTAEELSAAIHSAALSDINTAAALNHRMLSIMLDDLAEAPVVSDADLSLAQLGLLSSDETLALLDTLEPFGLSPDNLSGIISGSMTLRDAVHLLQGLAAPANQTISEGSAIISETSGFSDSSVLFGDSGLSGTSGPSETSGPSGIPGTSALSGLSGAGGSSGEASVSTGNISENASALQSTDGTATASPNAAVSLFRSLLQGAGTLFAGHSNDTATPPGVIPTPPAAYADAAPGSAPDTLLGSLPLALHTPEIYTIINTFMSFACRSQELSAVLSKQQRTELAGQLKGKLPSTVLKKLEDGDLTTAELLKLLLEQQSSSDSGDSSYLASETYQELLRQWLLARFSMQPQHLSDRDGIARYYETLDRRLAQLEKLPHATADAPSFQDSAAGIRDNIDFMKTLNQSFPYLQLPLRPADRTIHAELYVYSSPSSAASGADAPAHVLLHLDMEQLGPLDVHLSLSDREVQAHFYLKDSDSSILTQNNMSILQNALAAKGYHLTARTQTRSADINPVRDYFLPPESAAAMKRYSFDIRA